MGGCRCERGATDREGRAVPRTTPRPMRPQCGHGSERVGPTTHAVGPARRRRPTKDVSTDPVSIRPRGSCEYGSTRDGRTGARARCEPHDQVAARSGRARDHRNPFRYRDGFVPPCTTGGDRAFAVRVTDIDSPRNADVTSGASFTTLDGCPRFRRRGPPSTKASGPSAPAWSLSSRRPTAAAVDPSRGPCDRRQRRPDDRRSRPSAAMDASSPAT